MTLSPKLGVAEISTLCHFRLPLPIQMFIKVASFPRLSGIGMPSPILWSHLLKMLRIVLLSSLLWWELGTNSLITGPGEWLSFRHFTSKLSWSRPWNQREAIYRKKCSCSYIFHWSSRQPLKCSCTEKKKKNLIPCAATTANTMSHNTFWQQYLWKQYDLQQYNFFFFHSMEKKW